MLQFPHMNNSYTPEFGYGGIIRRFTANIVDSLIIGLITSSLSFGMFQRSFSDGSNFSFSSFAPGVLISAAYIIFFWTSQQGQTIGKKIMGLRVVSYDGQSINISTAVVRYIGYTISSILMLGYLAAIFDKQKRGWHDRLANTLVIKTDNKRRVFLTLLFTLVPILLLIIFVVGIISAGLAFKNSAIFRNKVVPEIKKELQKIAPTITENQSSELATEVFVQINSLRQSQSLTPLIADPKACAYAQRRLSQFKEFGGYDDSKGFYEDVANQQITRAYFADYKNVGENIYRLGAAVTADSIVTAWSNDASSNILIAKYNAGCIRTGNGLMVLISGQK